MMTLTFEDSEFFDENKSEFFSVKGQTIELEHSLVSVSKWEAKWKIPFLSREPKTKAQTIDYIRCMTKTQHVNPLLYELITSEQIEEVYRYMNDPMTATTISKPEGKGSTPKIITSEEIYASMVEFRVPEGYQKWHFNRLIILLRVLEERSKPKKKMRKGDIARQRRSLNAARRARLGTKG